MKLKIWHNSFLGHQPVFERPVPDVETAKAWIHLLWDYDLYQGERVTANASGLLRLDEATNTWDEWENELGASISMIVGLEKEEQAKALRKAKRKKLAC